MTVTHVDSFSVSHTTDYTVVDTTDITNGSDNIQIVWVGHRSTWTVAEITSDTSGGGAGDWNGPYNVGSEIHVGAERRILWMFWRIVPSDAGNFTVGFTTANNPTVICIDEFATSLSSGTWRIDSAMTGQDDSVDLHTNGPNMEYGAVDGALTASGIDKVAAITTTPQLYTGPEGFMISGTAHRNGNVSQQAQHSITDWTISEQVSSGSGSSNYSMASAYRILAETDDDAAWSWTTSTESNAAAFAFSYDTSSSGNVGPISAPTVKVSGNDTTEPESTSSWTPTAGRLYLAFVLAHYASDNDDLDIEISCTTGLNWVLAHASAFQSSDYMVGIWRAQEPSGLSSGVTTWTDTTDISDDLDYIRWAIIEVDGVDDSGVRGNKAVIAQTAQETNQAAIANGGAASAGLTVPASGGLTEVGEGAIAFFAGPNDEAGDSWEAGWTELHDGSDATEDILFRIGYDITATVDTNVTLSWTNSSNNIHGWILALSGAPAGGGGGSPFKVYNGSIWEVQPVKVYNGATWDTIAAADLKTYTGSGWT